jgi:hypothetical protein
VSARQRRATTSAIRPGVIGAVSSVWDSIETGAKVHLDCWRMWVLCPKVELGESPESAPSLPGAIVRVSYARRRRSLYPRGACTPLPWLHLPGLCPGFLDLPPVLDLALGIALVGLVAFFFLIRSHR